MKRDTKDLWPHLVVALALILSLFSAFSLSAHADTYRQGKTSLVSRSLSGEVADGSYPSVSADGRYVAFDSFARLSPQDGDSFSDVYVNDMTTGTYTLVSPDLPGVSVNRCNHKPSISADGTKVVYLSGFAFPFLFVLSPDCYLGTVILRDLPAATSSVVDLGPFFGVTGTISGDGGSIAVMAEGHESSGYNLMVYDVTTLSQRWFAGPITSGFGYGELGLSLSHDGRYVAFDSTHTFSNHINRDLDGDLDVYVHDRDTDGNGVFDEPGKTFTKLVGIMGDGSSPVTRSGAISGDGRYVIFLARETTIQLRDVALGSTQQVASWPIQTSPGNVNPHLRMGLSMDGRYSVFTSFNPLLRPTENLNPPIDLSPAIDAYVWDRDLRKLELVSLRPDGNQGMEDAMFPSISSDGRHVAFGVRLASFEPWIRLRTGVYLRDLSVPCDLACIPSGV